MNLEYERPTNGMRRYRKYILAFLVVTNLLFASGIMRSLPAQAASSPKWSVVGPAVPTAVNGVVNVDGSLYALSDGGANDVWTFDGKTWTRMLGSPSNVSHLLAYKGYLLAATTVGSNGIWSFDGATWTQLAGSPGNVTAIAIWKDQLLAATSSTSGSIWSYDGSKWQQMTGSPNFIVDLLEVNGTLYAGSRFGLHGVWAFDGTTWTLMADSPNNVFDLEVFDGVLLAGVLGAGNGVWRYDGAWTPMPGSPGRVYDLLKAGDKLYAGNFAGTNGVWTYDGAVWTQMPDSPSSVISLAELNGTLFAVGNNRLWSYDGTTWAGSPGNMTSLAEWKGTLFRSANSGVNDVWAFNGTEWERLPGSPGNVQSLAVSRDILYAGTSAVNNGIWAFDGTAWLRLSGSPGGVAGLLAAGDMLYATTLTGSDDVWSYDGTTWTRIPGSPGSVSALLESEGILYAGTMNGVWSYDGTAWAWMTGSPPNRVVALLESDGILYAGASACANCVWTFDGISWTQMTDSPNNVSTLLKARNTLYAGTQTNGAWSYDGTSWERMADSPTSARKLLYANGSLYAGGDHLRRFYYPPDAPVHLQADRTTATQTELTWNPVPTADSYTVFQSVYGSLDGQLPIAADVSSPSYTITGLKPSTKYVFTVTAVNAGGESAPSGPAIVETASLPPPASNGGPVTANPNIDDTPPTSTNTTLDGTGFRTDVVDIGALLSTMESKVNAAKRSTAAANLSDLTGHWASRDIQTFARLGLAKGYTDGTFKPDRSLTRAEFASMLDRVFPIKGGARTGTEFTDVSEHWAKAAILRLAQAGVVHGYEDSTFRPEGLVTREEMVVMLYRILDLSTVPKDANKDAFPDLSDSYAAAPIREAARAGILNGKTNGTFGPKHSATRAEALTILMNALHLNPKIDRLLNSLNPF